MSKRARGGATGLKYRMTFGVQVCSLINCACNSGALNLYIIAVNAIQGRLNRLPAASVGDCVLATVKAGDYELRKKVMPAVIVRQRKMFRRITGSWYYFQDNAGVIVNIKGEMKGTNITGPVGKEAHAIWPAVQKFSTIAL
ncbi:hypothetical protein PCE1_004751 [Barthelona sp. PCE]